MAFVYKTVGYLLLLTILGLYHEAHAGSVGITWFYQGSSIPSNRTLAFNAGDSFSAQCKGAGNSAQDGAGATVVVVPNKVEVYITKNGAISATNIQKAQSTAGVPNAVTFSGGSIVYNNFEGPATGYDHWEFSVLVSRKPNYATAILRVFVRSLSSVDAGTYFCGIYDGQGTTYATATVGASNALVLSITTKSAGRNLATNKMMDYSFALLAAYKVMF